MESNERKQYPPGSWGYLEILRRDWSANVNHWADVMRRQDRFVGHFDLNSGRSYKEGLHGIPAFLSSS